MSTKTKQAKIKSNQRKGLVKERRGGGMSILGGGR